MAEKTRAAITADIDALLTDNDAGGITGPLLNALFDTFNDSKLSKLSDVVSQAEAEAGIANTPRTWTAIRIFQAVAAYLVGNSYPQFLSPGGETAILENDGNWDANNNLTAVISNTRAGQKHSDNLWLYMAIGDNIWIRIYRPETTAAETFSYASLPSPIWGFSGAVQDNWTDLTNGYFRPDNIFDNGIEVVEDGNGLQAGADHLISVDDSDGIDLQNGVGFSAIGQDSFSIVAVVEMAALGDKIMNWTGGDDIRIVAGGIEVYESNVLVATLVSQGFVFATGQKYLIEISTLRPTKNFLEAKVFDGTNWHYLGALHTLSEGYSPNTIDTSTGTILHEYAFLNAYIFNQTNQSILSLYEAHLQTLYFS